jgi:hypothetical protein
MDSAHSTGQESVAILAHKELCFGGLPASFLNHVDIRHLHGFPC